MKLSPLPKELRMNRLLLFIFLAVSAHSLPAYALGVEEPLENPAQEQQAQLLFKELRCVVCQGESIADSPAEVARDMRLLVRARLAAGESRQSIKDFLVSRYGDHVLMTPPLKPATYGLWFGPPAILLLGAGLVLIYFRRNRDAA